VNLQEDELHPQIAAYHECLVQQTEAPVEEGVAGKINMGIGGVNACVICRRWPEAAS